MLENGAPAISAITYDHRNLPTSLINRNGDVVTYRYNTSGQRVYKKVGSQTPEYYILDGDQTVAVYQNGALRYWNILANGVTGRYEPGSGAKFYYVKDHLGSTRAVLNTSGTVVEAHDYYPFGLLMPGRSYTTGEETKEKFVGKELDSETGWYHLGSRSLMSALGRFPSPDRFADKYPSLSPYQYAANNPVTFIDVSGDSIWISYTDSEGNQQKLLYTQGMSTEGLSGVALKIVRILNVINTDKAGKTLLISLTGSTKNYFIQQGGLGEVVSSLYDPSTRTITIDPSKSAHLSTETGKFFNQLFSTVHELYHAFEHETIGDKYLNMGITTKSEGEAFDVMYSMYTRFRNQQQLDVSYRNDPIYRMWRNWKNAQITPYYRNYMSIIYREYKKLKWDIQYVGP